MNRAPHNRIARIATSSLAIAGLLCAGISVASTPAEAAFPGYNGKIVFESNRDGGNTQLYVMNPDGSDPTKITSDGALYHDPQWSPDGTRIAFRKNGAHVDIFVMNADGSSQQQLTNNQGGSNQNPNWSPDGALIAFRSNRDGNGEVYVMNPDGSGQTRLTTNAADDSSPAWSPDGSKILFTSNRDGNGEVYVMDADGSHQTRLTNDPGVDGGMTWAPDGSKVAFNSNRSGVTGVYTMDPDGSNVHPFAVGSTVNSAPFWSPDGTRILFVSERDGQREVYVAAIDGTGLTRLTNNPATDKGFGFQPVLNTPPLALADTLTLQTNTSASSDVLANDTDEGALGGSNLSITVQPTHGSAVIEAGKVKYTPTANYLGSDSLNYQICDSFTLDQKCSTAVLRITVTAGPIPTTPTITSVGTVSVNGESKVYYTGHRPTFTGTATPGSTITVEIHSDPIVLTTTGDSSGNWSVTPDQDIPNGEHTVTITATKDGATSEALSLVLGINVGLAETGVPVWPLTALAVVGAGAAYAVLRRRIGA